MRVIRRVDAGDERGISLVITAIALVAIFAMVVLVIDVGALLVKRRAMVKAADAAALAAAQSCARGLGDAESQADTFASLNAQGTLSGGIIAGGCDAMYVTVRYTTQQDLFFAPVLGFGSSDDVAAEATAAWGGVGAANPLPIVLNLATFQGDCDIPNVAKGTICHLWYDNDRFDGSNFGFLNLEQWNVSAGTGCHSAGSSQREDWITNDWGGDPLELNYPSPTYVCTDSGLSSSNWSSLEGRIGDILTFPVNDQATQIMNSRSQIDKYNIIGFAQMKLTDVLDVHEAGADFGTCSVNGVNFPNASPINLDQFGIAHNCFTAAPDTISNVLVSGNQVTTGMYTYDAGTRTITWTGPQRQNTTVSFDWRNSGVCGEAPDDSSARCILVEWVGHRFGGNKPGNGANLGLADIRLCDLKIANSCPRTT
jgi:Putative Flp pilus-assembly TadE/G-like